MDKETKFYKALEDVFVGAKIEGQGGFVNLMKIKSNYYSKIEKLLKSDIENVLTKYPDFKDELFDKLYSFFSRYFSESGSIYFNETPFHNNVYEKIYTDDKDIALFWKTQMLYYVKTDRIFRNLNIELDGFKFYFDVSNLEYKKANEKRNLIYELKEVKNVDEINNTKTIFINVKYSERGTKTKIDDIQKVLKREKINISDEQLEHAFRIFEKQSEVDYFINKNAKAFLQEQFKLWSYQYFWDGAKEWSSNRVNELLNLKDIAFKIIDFISQFEDELVKIWNKPKFVKNSNYVITLDKIKNIDLIKKIISHPNINEQINEWQELGIVDDSFNINEVIENDLMGKHLNKKYEHLPIDTKYFKDLEIEILSLFDDLDKSLDGWLIKSENYQALNTILPKFKETVQTIYIDPPFNLDSSDQFLYRTNYKDANWATLLENRLRLAKDWLNEKGSIFVRCDYNGNWIVRCLMDDILGKENFRNEITINRTQEFFKSPGKEPKKFMWDTDSLFLFSKTENNFFRQVLIERTNEVWWEPFLPSKSKPEDDFRIVFGEKIYSPNGRKWGLKQNDIDLLEKEGKIRKNNKERIEYFPKYIKLKDNWTDIAGYQRTWNFDTENAEILLKRVIESTSNENDLVMDFFLGSGTTTAVAHKLNRKWIGVEMGEHFYSVVLPRMKKVLAYDKSGISKEVNEYKGGGFFKYYELEQYEETLANCKYEDGDLFQIPDRFSYGDYVFMKDEKMLKALEIDYKNNKVNVDLSKLYSDIDIAETLSNLTGKWIKKITPRQTSSDTTLQEGNLTPLTPLKEGNYEVEFEDGTKLNAKNLDYKLIKYLIWWE